LRIEGQQTHLTLQRVAIGVFSTGQGFWCLQSRDFHIPDESD